MVLPVNDNLAKYSFAAYSVDAILLDGAPPCGLHSAHLGASYKTSGTS